MIDTDATSDNERRIIERRLGYLVNVNWQAIFPLQWIFTIRRAGLENVDILAPEISIPCRSHRNTKVLKMLKKVLPVL